MSLADDTLDSKEHWRFENLELSPGAKHVRRKEYIAVPRVVSQYPKVELLLAS
jgi:hypothetical protein